MIPHMLPATTEVMVILIMYQPRRPALPREMNVRGLRCRLHCWGDREAPPVLLLHGWADVGMSFQFLADALSDDWYLVAPDWRGFGESGWQPGGYWFPDYLADLDEMLDSLSPAAPVRLVGHSMGGNVAWLYAGIRPGRVSHAVSLDVYGLPDSPPENAPEHYARWLDQLKTAPSYTPYADLDGVAARIRRLAPRLDPGKALFLAGHWSRRETDGRYRLRHDPAHKRVNPVLYRRAEARSCWGKIRARTLLVLGEDSPFYEAYERDGHRAELESCIPAFTDAVIAGSGHMLHLEQPERLAGLLEGFLRQGFV